MESKKTLIRYNNAKATVYRLKNGNLKDLFKENFYKERIL